MKNPLIDVSTAWKRFTFPFLIFFFLFADMKKLDGCYDTSMCSFNQGMFERHIFALRNCEIKAHASLQLISLGIQILYIFHNNVKEVSANLASTAEFDYVMWWFWIAAWKKNTPATIYSVTKTFSNVNLG